MKMVGNNDEGASLGKVFGTDNGEVAENVEQQGGQLLVKPASPNIAGIGELLLRVVVHKR